MSGLIQLVFYLMDVCVMARACINALWKGMETANSTLAASCFDASMTLRTVNSTGGLLQDSVSELLKTVDSRPAGSLREVLLEPVSVVVSNDQLLGTVFGRYQFFLNGVLDHCGVDAFQFYWQNRATWLILSITDTRVACN